MFAIDGHMDLNLVAIVASTCTFLHPTLILRYLESDFIDIAVGLLMHNDAFRKNAKL